MKLKRIATALVSASLLSITATAQADGITEFRLGILGGENQSDRLKNHACMDDQLTELLGVNVELFAPADYNGVIEGLLGGNLDMAWLGASGYAKAYLENSDQVEPILVPINPDGSTGYYSIGFARVDSNIGSLEDMESKVFAFGDPNSTSGYLIPSIEIPSSGFSMESGEYFGEIAFSGGHEQTIVGVLNGDYDGGVTWADGQGEWESGFNNGAFRKAVDAGLVDMTELQEIWRSKEIPNGPVVLRQELPDATKKAVKDYLTNLVTTDPDCAYGFAAGEIQGFKEVNHTFFESIVAARAAKIGS